MESDKKRKSDQMNYVLLDEIGKARVHKIGLIQLRDLLDQVL